MLGKSLSFRKSFLGILFKYLEVKTFCVSSWSQSNWKFTVKSDLAILIWECFRIVSGVVLELDLKITYFFGSFQKHVLQGKSIFFLEEVSN